MRVTQAKFAGRIAGLMGAALVLAAPAAAQDAAVKAGEGQAGADILITGGTIYPGGADPFTGDIAIAGDRIVYAGPRYPHAAQRTISADGMIVAPGFIDPHTHADSALMSRIPAARLVLPFITQA